MICFINSLFHPVRYAIRILFFLTVGDPYNEGHVYTKKTKTSKVRTSVLYGSRCQGPSSHRAHPRHFILVTPVPITPVPVTLILVIAAARSARTWLTPHPQHSGPNAQRLLSACRIRIVRESRATQPWVF
jgi:hypothetical protein